MNKVHSSLAISSRENNSHGLTYFRGFFKNAILIVHNYNHVIPKMSYYNYGIVKKNCFFPLIITKSHTFSVADFRLQLLDSVGRKLKYSIGLPKLFYLNSFIQDSKLKKSRTIQTIMSVYLNYPNEIVFRRNMKIEKTQAVQIIPLVYLNYSDEIVRRRWSDSDDGVRILAIVAGFRQRLPDSGDSGQISTNILATVAGFR